MGQAQEDMATAIFDIAHQCLASFDSVVAEHEESVLTRSFTPKDAVGNSGSQRRPSFDFLGLRNSFLFWVDYTGALSLMNSSLDARLRGLTDISSMVIELLEMILRNVQRIYRKPDDPSTVLSDTTTANSEAEKGFLSKWEDASRAVDTALDRLHFIAVAIRKASAQQLDHTVATLLTKDDVVLGRDIALLVRYRFPAARKALCRQLGDGIAVRRRMLLQEKRHAKRLAVRNVPEKSSSSKQHQKAHLEPRPVLSRDRRVSHPSVLTSGITNASRPDPKAPVLGNLHLPKPRALTTVISIISTRQDDSFEYPPAPIAVEGETHVRCPFCFMPLEWRDLEKKRNELWKRHVDEHLKPYACLFPECTESLVFFARLHEWKAHMESAHSEEWMRKVHTSVWYCDLKHEITETKTETQTFETELQWREHMQDLKSHPGKSKAPTQAQLDALSPRRQRVAPRDKFVCPLCEQIPEKLRPLEGKGIDHTHLYNAVVDHIATHLKSLSLLAVPSLENATPETPGAESALVMKDSSRRPLNENSVPQPPSGREYIDGASLPPDSWSVLHRNDMVSFPTSLSWDKEHTDYAPQEDPPLPFREEWIERWNSWKRDNDPFPPGALETDPVLTHLRKSKGLDSVQTSIGMISPEVRDVDSKNEAGRTTLSFAAEAGDCLAARQLLEMGANLEIAGQDGQTPLLWAADNGHETTVRLLLDNGARIEAADQVSGRTPLSWAASKGHQAVVQLLLDQGAEVDAADNSRRTPLSGASLRGQDATVQLLAQHGADIELPDPKYGGTPLSWASVRGHETVVRLLLDLGADVDAVDLEHGRTPLSWAAENGHEEVVRILSDRGADLEAPDLQGWTPLTWATENGHDNVAQLLRSYGAKSPSAS